MKVNFIFVRHGYGCHNAVKPLYDNGIISQENGIKFTSPINLRGRFQGDDMYIDPELTQIGSDASAYNGCVISKTVRKIGFKHFDKDEFSSINIVGCSPLIRSMETAYEMTKSWNTKPDKIYVFPYLRELDEHSTNKYSDDSNKKMNTYPSYAMKSIEKQKEYLTRVNLNNIVDFSYVENNSIGREEAGDIPKFIRWFNKEIISNIEPVENLNVFIVTHAGVLKDYMHKKVLKYYETEEEIFKTVNTLGNLARSRDPYLNNDIYEIANALTDIAADNAVVINAIGYLVNQSLKAEAGNKDDVLIAVNNIISALAPTYLQILHDCKEKEEIQCGFVNNSGFIVSYNTIKRNETENDIRFSKYISLSYHYDKFYPFEFFYEYNNQKYLNQEYYCPSNRCSHFCNNYDSTKQIKKIDVECKNTEDTNLNIKDLLKKK
jgi:broad specificity phosphatase PhoE